MAYEPELERLERRYQDDPARWFAQLAEAYRKANRLEDALTLLQGHLTERPNYVSGLVVLGRCQLDQQSYTEARETFERVLGVDSEHIIALRALGEIAERAGDYGSARQWFARLLDVDPMNEDAEQALARIAQAEAAPKVAEAETPPAAPPAAPSRPMEAPAGEAPSAPPASQPAEHRPPDTFPVPPVEKASWGPRTAEFAGEEPAGSAEAGEAATPAGPVESRHDPEFVIEQADDRFMPRPSGAHPQGVESIGELDIRSQIQDHESPLGGAAEAAKPDYELPTGERDIDLGAEEAGAAADQLAEEGPGRAPGTREGLGITAFDDSLGWGAGERTSRQISREDLDEIADTHEDTVAPVSELPGLEQTDVPTGDEATGVGPVEGLQQPQVEEVQPLEGLEVTAQGETLDEEPVSFVEPPREDQPETVEVGYEDVRRVAPQTPEETGDAAMDASGELADRGTAERRASLMGLPLLEGGEAAETEAPLVLEAEPEPVLTETMADLYVNQGLFDEAREVYERLLAARPGDARLKARLAELESAKPARASVQYDAARSGGQSARAMMVALLAARPGAPPVPPPAAPASPPGPPAAPAPATVAVEAAPPAKPVAPMDEAFSEDHGDTALGAPTQPAEDEVTLASIFGEPAAPVPKPSPAPPQPAEPKAAAGKRAPGGFSFDEFFGKPGGGGDAGERPQRDSMADDEGDEAFKDWLKSLKG